jgi:hypothetical protein
MPHQQIHYDTCVAEKSGVFAFEVAAGVHSAGFHDHLPHLAFANVLHCLSTHCLRQRTSKESFRKPDGGDAFDHLSHHRVHQVVVDSRVRAHHVIEMSKNCVFEG